MNLNFNPYAFVRPKNKAEYAQLLDEALRMADELHEKVMAITLLAEQGRHSSAPDDA